MLGILHVMHEIMCIRYSTNSIVERDLFFLYCRVVGHVFDLIFIGTRDKMAYEELIEGEVDENISERFLQS
jgi:hypothetical protein